ncbi:RadC family protein [Portibacter marinus]|uniref:RadC family protein n=1 Tax=Portibacter marinus TaxID=2898660 RepID=UPI001F2BF24A|nr:DNA repair protein RadC [Portibacter marinus]
MIIKDWALEDRPREKLYMLGPRQLTNAELLAIILSSGTRTKSALEVAKELLAASDNNLDKLAIKDIEWLMEIQGIGHAKAIAIKAAMELANRRSERKVKRRKITSSEEAYEEVKNLFLDLQVEEFWVAYLNRGNRILARERISVGGVAGTIVDPKVIFKPAILLLATGVILFHNHPSGNLKPSRNDLMLTNKLIDAGRQLDIVVHDHLIVGNGGYYSFRDEGEM